MSRKKRKNPWEILKFQQRLRNSQWPLKSTSKDILQLPDRQLPVSGAPSAHEVLADPGSRRWKRLLHKIDQDPELALEDPRCLKPPFLALYFDLCDGKVLEAPWVAQDYVKVAVELAEKTDDPHQKNLAKGVAVHLCSAGRQWQVASDGLKSYRHSASKCCRICFSDWLRRYGDLLAEARSPYLARDFLKISAQVLGKDLNDDTRGRILFVRSTAYFFQGKRARALDDAGRALMLMSLDSPRGYFLDGLAFVACFLEACQSPRFDRRALEVLADFGERLKGLKGWNEVRDRLRWVEGQFHARLGHPRRARSRLERARKAHTSRAPHRWALAIGIDHAMTYCHGDDPETYLDRILRVMKECRQRLNLEPELRQRVVQFLDEVKRRPWRVDELLEEFRRSFVVPVPGLLVELRREAVCNREWRYGSETA